MKTEKVLFYKVKSARSELNIAISEDYEVLSLKDKANAEVLPLDFWSAYNAGMNLANAANVRFPPMLLKKSLLQRGKSFDSLD